MSETTAASPLQDYLSSRSFESISPAMVSYLANLQQVAEVNPGIARSIVKELEDQRSNLKLIASENYTSTNTQAAMGNLLTDKYAEGFAGSRYYAGCDNIDDIESEACRLACELFKAEHAYVQPHSGADANMIAFWAILQAKVGVPTMEALGEPNPAKLSREDWNKVRAAMGNQRMLGLDYYSGGHLTHGYRFNVSAQFFDAYSYSVSEETGLLDYDALEKQAEEVKPLILLAGYSAYPRKVNFRRMKEIADKVGAVLMVDMAHFAGLVAGDVFEGDFNPMPFADVVTSTTHKTLRGPRGGIVLCKKEFAEFVDKGCPLVIGGPLPHVMAAKAIAFQEALKPEFKEYAAKVVENTSAMADAMIAEGLNIATGGSDNHLLLINVTSFGLNGRQAEAAVREAGVTLNRNSLPFDPNGPHYTSGLRVGAPAVTSLGMGVEQMKEIASIFKLILSNTKPATIATGKNAGQQSKVKYELSDEVIAEARGRVKALLDEFVLYPEIDLDFLKASFGG
ncbi:glycine hydroxymethyltransferase [Pelagicoccus sp. SDUM812002]|uniref:glycine hydroxymethyltransferase n=1 Tax=Pelagicoccus sp. SDUM812002 TaxID=3041266 RepID=UPI00280E6ABC|nr:glycine hydroxymethyltransferase [Pelagicoccus sp. SDUM812002]MDQ8188005.1 glycine hydroxymethyltransferase [Pelagicoccus sp. SDUM812002]